MRELSNVWRRLCKRPGYTLLSILVLGVGLAVALFGFSVTDNMVLRPLPFPHAARLTAIGYANKDAAGLNDMSMDEFLHLQPTLHTIDQIGAYEGVFADVDAGHDGTLYQATAMSASMLSMLGVQPLLGRGFSPDDDRPGAAWTVLLGESVWRHDFHADAHIIGRTIRVDGRWTTVIGVLPKSFAFPFDAQLWLPMQSRLDRDNDVAVVARLGPSVSLTQARQELQAVAATLGVELRGQRAGRRLVMEPLALGFVNEDLRNYVWLIFAASLLVLLLACINVANLQLVQTLHRSRDLALRSVLGAGRGLLLIEQLIESLLLSAAAVALALLLTRYAQGWFVSALVDSGGPPPYFFHFAIDMRLLVFAFAMVLAVTMLAGLLPAWRASRTDAQDVLRDGDRSASGNGFARATKTLVVIEIAFTVILLVGAGTFIRGFARVLTQSTSHGTDPAHVLDARVRLQTAMYPDDAARERSLRQLVARLRTMPGVIDASAANTIPYAMLGSHEFVAAYGAAKGSTEYLRAQTGIVDEHFAATYGLRLLEGRFFDARDRIDSLPATVIDQRLAHALWPGRDALGQRLVLHPEDPMPTVLTVIGVVAPVQLDGSLETMRPGLMRAMAQVPIPYGEIAVHTRDEASTFQSQLLRVASETDPNMRLFHIYPQARLISTSLTKLTLLIQIFSVIGLVALLLAAAGLYGVLSFAVARRTREIGIRRAIGAGGMAIVMQVGRQLLSQLGLGLVIGTALALPWSSLLTDPRLRTERYDPAVFVPVLLLVVTAAVIAALVPLRRALAVDPMVALHYE